MKRFGPVVFLMLTVFGGTAVGQAMVGYGLGAARAATTIAPARAAGKSLDKPWKKLETAAKSAPSTKAAAAANYEDPARIEAGIAYSDLIRRFGRPSMEITGEDGASTLTYLGKSAHAELVVRDGKVASADVRRIGHAALPR